jgi:hypothetical protein
MRALALGGVALIPSLYQFALWLIVLNRYALRASGASCKLGKVGRLLLISIAEPGSRSVAAASRVAVPAVIAFLVCPCADPRASRIKIQPTKQISRHRSGREGMLRLSLSSRGPTTIQAFVDGLRGALATFNSAAVSTLFEYPCLVASPAPRAFRSADELRIYVEEAFTNGNPRLAMGVARVLDDAREFDKAKAHAVVTWILKDGAGREVQRFTSGYGLRRSGGVWRAFAVATCEKAI